MCLLKNKLFLPSQCLGTWPKYYVTWGLVSSQAFGSTFYILNIMFFSFVWSTCSLMFIKSKVLSLILFRMFCLNLHQLGIVERAQDLKSGRYRFKILVPPLTMTLGNLKILPEVFSCFYLFVCLLWKLNEIIHNILGILTDVPSSLVLTYVVKFAKNS